MNRRDLFGLVTLGVASVSGSASATPAPARPAEGRRLVRFKLGCQSGSATDKRLAFFARHGVKNICTSPPDKPEGRLHYTADELSQLRERCEKQGITLDMLTPPFLKSSHVDRTRHAAIMLGQSPERDRDIEQFQMLIRNCARAGIPAMKYNMSLLGVVRSEATQGRGGVRLSTWRLAEAGDRAKRLTRAGRVPADLYWERISYFLERVVPVAEEHKIRIACHPHDPGLPPGFEGVDTVLGTVDGLKKFVSIKESAYHGLNFCQGTVSEMLRDPGREILDVIRWFGSRKKLFNVHFRNIRGRRDSFQEVYPDEGDVDFVEAIRVYREVDYPYMLMPDHVPKHPDDPDGLQAFAFSYGYIRALIQASDRLV